MMDQAAKPKKTHPNKFALKATLTLGMRVYLFVLIWPNFEGKCCFPSRDVSFALQFHEFLNIIPVCSLLDKVSLITNYCCA